MALDSLVGLSEAELTTLKANVLTAINAVLTGAQSYSRSGRSYTKADLGALRETLAQINYAIAALPGAPVLERVVYADMSN